MVIGDVCGKGPDAAAVTALARYTIRAAAMHETRPTRVLETLNEAMLEQQPERPFCTIGYGRVQPGPGGACLTVASAGHPLPLVLRADGRVESLGRPGTILGVFPDVVISDDDTALRAGDAVVFYTDGVTEARGDGDIYGDERLVELLAGAAGSDAAGIADRIEQSVLDFEHGAPRDDMAVLVLRVSP